MMKTMLLARETSPWGHEGLATAMLGWDPLSSVVHTFVVLVTVRALITNMRKHAATHQIHLLLVKGKIRK